jgi:hypothetical protein
MIWEAAFTPRRIKLIGSGHRPILDKMNRRLMLVGGESLDTFNLYYKRLFSALGQRPLLINPRIDTLVFVSGLKGFWKMCRQYPEDMRKLRRIDIRASSGMVHGPNWKQWEEMDLSCLSPDCLITVRHSYDIQPFPVWEDSDNGVQIIQALGYLKNSLLHGKEPQAPYTGPQLAAVFPATQTEWHEWIYFCSTDDIRFASWGRMRLNKENFQQELIEPSKPRIVWLAKNQVWGKTERRRIDEVYPNDLHRDIFHEMQQSRLFLTEYQMFQQTHRKLRRILLRYVVDDFIISRREQYFTRMFQILAENELTLEANDSTNKGTIVRVNDGPEYKARAREIESAMRYPYAELRRIMDGHLIRRYEAQKVATPTVEFEDDAFVHLVDGQFLDAVDASGY